MGVLYTDDFNRANGAPGANWIGSVGDEFLIVSNQLIRNLAGSGSDFHRWVPAMPTSDHYAEAKVVSFPGGAYLAIDVRGSGPMSAPTLYMAFYDPGVTCWTIGKLTGGSYAGVLSSAGGVAAPAAGTVLRLEVEGTALRFYAANVLVLSTTDSSITTGTQVGVNANAIAGIGFDEFAAGDFAAAGPTFVTGRMWDDENGIDTVGPLALDGYTELEWNLKAQAPAAAGEVYQFRVQAGLVPFDTYTLTPQLTVATPAALTENPTDTVGIADTATPVKVSPGVLAENPIDTASITDTVTPDLVTPGGAVTYTELLDARQTLTLPSGNFVSGSFTTAAGKVLLAVQRMDNQAPGETTTLLEADVPTPTTAGLTWLKVGSAFNTGRHWSAHIFYWIADCPSIATRTFTQSGSGTWLTEMSMIDLSIYELTGAAAAAAQTKTPAKTTHTEDVAHQDPGAQSLTLPTAPATTSVVFATYAGDCDASAGPITVTQGAGWTEVSEIPGSPLTSQVQTRTGSTSTAVDWVDLSSVNVVWDYSLFAWEVIVPGGANDYTQTVTDTIGITDTAGAGPIAYTRTVTDPIGITDYEVHTYFPVPTSTANRKFLDQYSNVFLLRSMAFWGVGQNATNPEITSALNGLSGRSFNAVTASACGSTPDGTSGWVKYKNIAGQDYFTGTPYASSLGAAWSTIDWLMTEASRLQMTVLFSLFVSWGATGSNGDIASAGTTNMYNFGFAVASRYAAYRNIIWHVMGDDNWDATSSLGVAIDAYYHGIRDAEGSAHRLITAEHNSPRSCYAQFISQEGTSPAGYQWFRVSADAVYDYGSASVEQFEAIYADANAPTYPVWDCEPPYVHAGWYAGNEPQQVRERNYGTFIPNGVGINYGDEYFWPTGKQGLFGGTHTDWLTQIDSVTSVQAGYAWSLIDTYVKDLTWAPATFVTTGVNSGDDKAAVGASNTALLAYFPSTRATVVVDTTVIVGTGNVRLRWYDPTAGTFATITASEAQTASRTVTYPAAHGDGTSDYVLVVDGASGTPLTQTITDTVGVTDSIAIVRAITVTDTIGATDAASADLARPATDNATFLDTVSAGLARPVTDTVGVTDTASADFARPVTDTTAITDTAVSTQAHAPTFTDTASITDTAAAVLIYARTITDTLGVTDVADPIKVVAGAENPVDTLGIGDIATTVVVYARTVTDSFGISDTAASEFARPVIDTSAVTDTATPALDKPIIQTDTLGITDQATPTLVYARTATDTLGIADDAQPANVSAAAQIIPDSVAIADIASTVAIYPRTQTDTASIVDTVSGDLARPQTDIVGITDTVAPVVLVSRTVTDTVGFVSTATTSVSTAGGENPSDAIGITDTVTFYLSGRQITDTAAITDSLVFGRGLGNTDTVGVIDSTEIARTVANGQADVVGITDTVTGVLQKVVIVTDNLGVTDVAAGVLSGVASTRHVQTAQNVQLTQVHVLAVANAHHAQKVSNISLGIVIVLNDAVAVYLGTTPIQAVYAGSTKVWP